MTALQALPPAPFGSPGGDTSLPSPDLTPVPICCGQPGGEAPRWCGAELAILRALMKCRRFPPIPSTTLLCGHLPLSLCPLVPLSWGLGPAGFLLLPAHGTSPCSARWLPCPIYLSWKAATEATQKKKGADPACSAEAATSSVLRCQRCWTRCSQHRFPHHVGLLLPSPALPASGSDASPAFPAY